MKQVMKNVFSEDTWLKDNDLLGDPLCAQLDLYKKGSELLRVVRRLELRFDELCLEDAPLPCYGRILWNSSVFQSSGRQGGRSRSLDVEWTECANIEVFPNGDTSLPSAFTVFPNVIQKRKRSVIARGLLDFPYIAEGTRIVFQK